MKKKILILGSQGLLGSALTPYLKSKAYYVITHSRKSGTDIEIDLINETKIISIFKELKPDIVINLAALTNVDECEQNPQSAYLSNVLIVENITHAIMKAEINSHLIQISTDQVYDGQGSHKEHDVTLTNYYAFSKYAGELAATLISSTIVRTNFFGLSQCTTRISFSDWIINSLIKGENIKVFNDVYFSPLSFQTLIKMIEKIIISPKKGIFNLGSKDGMSKADFAFYLSKLLHLSNENMRIGSCEEVKLLAYRPKNMCMDSTLFEKTYNVILPTVREEIELIKTDYSHVSV